MFLPSLRVGRAGHVKRAGGCLPARHTALREEVDFSFSDQRPKAFGIITGFGTELLRQVAAVWAQAEVTIKVVANHAHSARARGLKDTKISKIYRQVDKN